MESWKLDEIFALMGNEELVYVESFDRAYISSLFWGTSRYHVVDNERGEQVNLVQICLDENKTSRVTFQRDEVPALLKFLLDFYLEHKRLTRVDVPQESLGDLDDHPF